MINKHLQNAVRYLHSTHNIMVNEKRSEDSLAFLIENLIDQMESPKLLEYWNAYEQDTKPQLVILRKRKSH